MYRHSLRTRVAIAFAICVALLSIVWGFAFLAAVRLSEDRVLIQQLQVAAQNYPVMPANLRGYDTAASLPAALQAWAQTNPAAGIYEFEAQELHVAVISTGTAQPAFVVFDVSGIEAASSEDWWLLLVISAVVGTLGVLGFGLGVLVMRRAVAPVVQLANAVADIDVEHLSAEDYKRIGS
ncbi:MAG: sensor histidine kinase, partial [Gammaproteobacteria bacterium]|nr:sensor histidine kinase [Gammaproteobacteria bacterium]